MLGRLNPLNYIRNKIPLLNKATSSFAASNRGSQIAMSPDANVNHEYDSASNLKRRAQFFQERFSNNLDLGSDLNTPLLWKSKFNTAGNATAYHEAYALLEGKEAAPYLREQLNQLKTGDSKAVGPLMGLATLGLSEDFSLIELYVEKLGFTVRKKVLDRYFVQRLYHDSAESVDAIIEENLYSSSTNYIAHAGIEAMLQHGTQRELPFLKRYMLMAMLHDEIPGLVKEMINHYGKELLPEV